VRSMLAEAVDTFVAEAARPIRDLALERERRRLARQLGHAWDVQGAAFLRRLAALRPRFPDVQEALRIEDWEPLLDAAFGLTRSLFRRALDRAIRAAIRLGFGAGGVTASFDLANPRAVAYLRDHGADLVAGIEETTREHIRALLVQAAAEGWPYGRTAREIGRRFAEFRVGRPQEHIRSRAELVAVTELGNAYEHGTLLAAEQEHASGTPMEKRWLAVMDDRTEQECRDNHAAGWIPVDQPFPSGHQRPLAHPACRCTLLTRPRAG
jgi:hypothetical protein